MANELNTLPQLSANPIVSTNGSPTPTFMGYINNAFSSIQSSITNLGVQLGLIQAAQSTADQALSEAEAAQIAAAASQVAADTAQDAADAARADAAALEVVIDRIASDNILSQVEKKRTIREHADLLAEQSDIVAKANLYGITTETTAYQNSITALTTYLGTLTSPVSWNNISDVTNIVGTTFRARFSDALLARQIVLNKIADVAKSQILTAGTTAVWNGVSGTGRPEDNADVTAGKTSAFVAGQGPWATESTTPSVIYGNIATANTIASQANTFANDVADNNKFSKDEKKRYIQTVDGWTVTVPSLVTQGNALGLTAQASALNTAWTNFLNYLVSVSYNNLSNSSSISRTTFRSLETAFSTALTNLSNALDTEASRRSLWSGVTGTGRPEDNADVTSGRTAAFVVNQSPWATTTLPTARLNNLDNSGNLSSLANISTRNLNQLNNRAWTNLFRGNGSTAITDADAITSLGTAAAISGQGVLATRNSVNLASADVINKSLANLDPGAEQSLIASFRPKQNLLFNGRFRLGLNGWDNVSGNWNFVRNSAGQFVEQPYNTGGTFVLRSNRPIFSGPGATLTISLQAFANLTGANDGTFADIEWFNGNNGTLLGYSSSINGNGANIFINVPSSSPIYVSQVVTAPSPTDGSGFVRGFVRIVSVGPNPYQSGGHAALGVKVEAGNTPSAISDEATDGAVLDNTFGRIRNPQAYNTQAILGPRNTTNLTPSYSVGGSNVTVNLGSHARRIAGNSGPVTLNYGASSGVVGFNTNWVAYVDDPELTGFASPSVVYTTNQNDLLFPNRYMIASGRTPNSGGGGGGVGTGGGTNGPGFDTSIP